MESIPKKIKFAETLALLLQQRGASELRKKICRQLGLTQSVLTQYLHGHSLPRLNTVVELADLLGVDLDFLILGQAVSGVPAPDINVHLERISRSVATLEAGRDVRLAVMGRLTSLLIEQVGSAAEKIAVEYQTTGGLIHDDELATLENFSEETILVRQRLDHLEPEPDAPVRAEQSGRFLPIVAKNLNAGKKYTYVLHTIRYAEAKEQAVEFYANLRSFGVTDSALGNCTIGVTRMPVIAGCILYNLDLNALAGNRRDLSERLEAGLLKKGGQGWMGCTLPPSPMLYANPLMDLAHTEAALRVVRYLQSNEFRQIS